MLITAGIVAAAMCGWLVGLFCGRRFWREATLAEIERHLAEWEE
jgi:hypothetical protein